MKEGTQVLCNLPHGIPARIDQHKDQGGLLRILPVVVEVSSLFYVHGKRHMVVATHILQYAYVFSGFVLLRFGIGVIQSHIDSGFDHLRSFDLIM